MRPPGWHKQCQNSSHTPPSPLSWLGELTTMEGTALNLLGMAYSSACIRVLFLLCLICYPSAAPQPGSVTLPEDRFCTVWVHWVTKPTGWEHWCFVLARAEQPQPQAEHGIQHKGFSLVPGCCHKNPPYTKAPTAWIASQHKIWVLTSPLHSIKH